MDIFLTNGTAFIDDTDHHEHAKLAFPPEVTEVLKIVANDRFQAVIVAGRSVPFAWTRRNDGRYEGRMVCA